MSNKKKYNNFLESQINKVIEYINENRLGFGWKNNPNRNYQGVFLEGEPFDYCIITKEKTYCFDCKQTESPSWHILKKDVIQALNLNKIDACGRNAFFLIYFILDDKLMKIDVKKVLKILSDRKYIKPDDCILFTEFNDIIKTKSAFK
jgi:penicillin-binding protein-related factor A (putative recombinase)